MCWHRSFWLFRFRFALFAVYFHLLCVIVIPIGHFVKQVFCCAEVFSFLCIAVKWTHRTTTDNRSGKNKNNEKALTQWKQNFYKMGGHFFVQHHCVFRMDIVLPMNSKYSSVIFRYHSFCYSCHPSTCVNRKPMNTYVTNPKCNLSFCHENSISFRSMFLSSKMCECFFFFIFPFRFSFRRE